MLTSPLLLSIDVENGYQSRWLKILLPYAVGGDATVSLCNAEGALMKKATLSQGLNAVDISGISGASVHVKIETAFETVFKEIKLD